jgi:hypothetical protein
MKGKMIMKAMFKLIYLVMRIALPINTLACDANKSGFILTLMYNGLESRIPKNQKQELEKIVQQMKNNKKLKISINTYTYDKDVNVRRLRIIGLERAMAIRVLFLNRDIDMQRIFVHVMEPGKLQVNTADICKVEK